MYGDMVKSKTVGYAAQLRIAATLLYRGFTVAFVEGDNAPYDLIADSNGKLSRVQVKSTENLGSVTHHHYGYHVNVTKGNKRTERYTKADCDFIAVLIGSLNIVYLIPVDEINGVSLRLYPGGQRRVQKNSHDYERFRTAFDLLR